MSSPTIDYEALAKQAGAISSQPAGVDYAALAKRAGAISSTPPNQQQAQGSEAYAPAFEGEATTFGAETPTPTEALSLLPVAGATIGAVGGPGGMAVGAGIGRLAEQGIRARYSNEPVPSTTLGAAADVGGEMAAAGLLGKAGEALPGVINRFRPSALKAGASSIYNALSSEVGDLPIPMKQSGPLLDEIAGQSEWTQWPQGLKKLYTRVTAPNKPGMTYDVAQEVYSDLGSRAQVAAQRGNDAVAFKYRQMQRAVLNDTNDALETVGKQADYARARGDWARAKQLEDQYEYIKSNVLPSMLKGAAFAIGGGAAVGAASKFINLADLLGTMR